MRILINSLNYHPELTGIGKYTGEMAEWLSQHGHEVRVVTAPPYYPEWEISKEYSSLFYRQELIEGVKVWRCPIWVPRYPSGLKRILHLVSFAISSFPIMLSHIFWRPNIILVVEPPLFCTPTTLITALLCRAKSWLHVQDFEVDAAFDLGILKSTRFRRLVLKAESWLMNRFDRVSSISEQMMLRLSNKGIATDAQILFPNWVDIDHIYPLENPSTFRKKLEIAESNIIFLYSGNMGEKQGLEIIVEAAQRLYEHKNISFVMCGQGAAYSRLRELAKGLNNIYWLPLQSLEQLNDLLNMADIHLLPQKVDAADLVLPSKLTGMLASGKPVLATAIEGTQISKVLEETGIVVPPENTDLFVEAILKLALDEEQRLVLGKKAREYAVEHLGHDAVLRRFEEDLKEVISHKL